MEDYERAEYLDRMYLEERQQEIEDEYRLWEEEQQKLPAQIVILNPIKKEETK